MTDGPASVDVDATGLRCPAPVLAAARAARGLRAGDVLVVRATDPATVHDLPAWARLRGHAVESVRTGADGVVVVAVRLAG